MITKTNNKKYTVININVKNAYLYIPVQIEDKHKLLQDIQYPLTQVLVAVKSKSHLLCSS